MYSTPFEYLDGLILCFQNRYICGQYLRPVRCTILRFNLRLLGHQFLFRLKSESSGLKAINGT